MEKPTYRHGCGSCVFLGSYQHDSEVHDLYCCNQSLVLVRSDNPEDTFGIFAISFENGEKARLMKEDFPALGVAFELAKAKGLI